MSVRPNPANSNSQRLVIARLPALAFALVLVFANSTLFADEIDDAFSDTAPALFERQGDGFASGVRLITDCECDRDADGLPVSGHPAFVDFDETCPHGSCLDFDRDLHGFLPTVWSDAKAIVNWNNTAILGGALATSLAFRQNLDDRVRRNTARHPERWGEGSKTLGRIGEVQYHVAVMAVLYGISVKRNDEELHGFMSTLASAYTINGLSTMALKGIANTERPSDEWNGGQFGFPSFHASSSFTIAAVVDEYYGPKAGLPAYALAGLISWSRIDERDHDLSDVFFGAAMGYVIGHAVAGQHLRCDSRVRLLPYFHPTEGTSGLMVDVSF